MKKKTLSLALALIMCLGLTLPAFAAEQKTIYVQYVDVKDSSGLNVSGSRTAPAGEEKESSLRLESDGLTETGVFYEAWEDTLTGPYPVYASTSPVKVTLTEGCTKEETLQYIAGGEFEGGVDTLCVDKVTYNEADKSITVLQENAAFFEGMVYFDGKDPCTIREYYSQDEDTHEEYFWSSPSIEIGSTVTLSQPGTYCISESWSNAYGSTQALIIISESQPEQPVDTKPTTPTDPAVTVEDIPASGTAIASNQTVTVDGKKVEFQMYALADANGNLTNYIKLRDMAYVLNGTKAQFSVGFDGTISLTAGQAYTAAGGEMTTPFSGDRAYKGGTQSIKVNGSAVDMTAITLTDDAGGAYNYFKLRDLGKALGFNVGYSNGNGVFIESDKPYAG